MALINLLINTKNKYRTADNKVQMEINMAPTMYLSRTIDKHWCCILFHSVRALFIVTTIAIPGIE